MTTPPKIFSEIREHRLDVGSIAAGIAAVQGTDGEIPWCVGRKSDPWDMVEAAMGLSIGGYSTAAERAYRWLIRCQNPDGSWYTSYRNGVPEDTTRDANLSAYIAVGIYQHYLISGDRSFLEWAWLGVRSAIDFALGLQSPHGEIYWAVSPEGNVDRMALLTGSSSICMSIRCALAIARQLGCRQDAWQKGLAHLVHAISEKPQRFNMTKSRYAMDWYYPVLCGVFGGRRARQRIDHLWKKFVIEGQGVRCVSDRPWITIAETAELSLALSAAGLRPLAQIVFSWIADKHYEDGMYWTGFTFPDMTVWPEDRLTWTSAAVLMAADALYDLTPASRLFSQELWGKQAQTPSEP